MINKFVILGKVQLISKDNPDYPGFYIQPTGEDNLIPISFHRDENVDYVLKEQVKQLNNNSLVCVSGNIKMTPLNQYRIKLYADKLTIISKN